MNPTESPFVKIIRRIVDPMLVVGVLLMVTLITHHNFDGEYMMLAIIAFFIASQVFDDRVLFHSCARGERWNDFSSIMASWGVVIGFVLFITFAAKISVQFSRIVLVSWFLVTPLVLYLAHRIARVWVRHKRLQGDLRKAIVVGASEHALRLAQRIHQDGCLMIGVDGFFEDRTVERVPTEAAPKLLGNLEAVADYVKTHGVDIVYITLPLSRLPRMQALMEALHDTTVSIYMVPDVFLYDLIQARVESIGGVPVIGLRETPFDNIHSFQKRMLDIALSLVILPLISPILLAVAIGVKVTSPGPVLFKQRRYGLGGDEIYVYKFRSMTVREDGNTVTQATRNDARITKLGAILRRTSLDELPQFINVLQGRMSIVGPRPHAVAHNEMYRKLISGYMIRHKVKPGITGWAQVNGLRGETDAIEKMQQRVQYDIAYLRDWSLSFDLRIIMRTFSVLVRGDNAY
ncbi:MAG: undecaprenyl-phosphate glucose phosphotransferase [Burkholderiaceae bacterium]